MFTRWGDVVYRFRFGVLGVVVAALLALGGYGLGLHDELSSGGMDDPGSESALAGRLADSAFGRNHDLDVVVLYTAPPGRTVDDPEFSRKIVDNLNSLPRAYPGVIAGVNGAYWQTETGRASGSLFATSDRTRAVAAVAIVGNNDTVIMANTAPCRTSSTFPASTWRSRACNPSRSPSTTRWPHDTKRMEVLAIPAVACCCSSSSAASSPPRCRWSSVV